jgi:F0F1-type ATP synthase membrane subunit b/b'
VSAAGIALISGAAVRAAGGRVLALAAPEAQAHTATFLGLPLWLWQLVNLVAFLAVLLYFVARPLATMFRNRQLAVEARLREAKELRAEAARLGAEVHDRMARLDQEIAQIRARGLTDGETERAALSEKADREVERVRREADEEIGRRLAAAKQELKKVAADLTAGAARELLAAQITDEDRRRLLDEGVARLASEPRGQGAR